VNSSDRRKEIIYKMTESLQSLPLEEQRDATMYVMRILIESFCEASGINGKAAIATLALRGVTAEELEGAFKIIRNLHDYESTGKCVCKDCSPELADSAFEVIPRGEN
jgi:anthranilate phosphoribosyltransferase